MAHTAAENAVFFQRMQNAAIALQNIREEWNRLKLQYQHKDIGNSEFFVAEGGITPAEIDDLRDVLAQIENVFSNVQVNAGFRDHILVPFLTNDPQI